MEVGAALREHLENAQSLLESTIDGVEPAQFNAKPPGLAWERDSLMQKWTSLTAATNLAAHLVGPGGTIVWLGADGKLAADGRQHHYDRPHRWPYRPGCYDKQKADLVTIVPSLRARNISLFNASPGTAWADLAPVVDLQDMLGERQAA